MDEVRLVLEEVTPERALDLLVGNTDNRNVRTAVVNAYARDMKNGLWRAGQGEPVHIGPDGTIGNGQHRLMAILESETAVLLPMLYAPLEWRMSADQGIKRTFADVLRMNHHEGNPNQLAAAVRYVWEYRRVGIFGTGGHTVVRANSDKPEYLGKPTVAELEAVYKKEKGLSESLVWIARLRDAGVPIFPSLYATLDYLFREVDWDDAEEFGEKLWKGDELPKLHPILALRRVMQNPSRPHRARAQAALVIKAWNGYRQGEDVQLLVWRAGGSHPEPFPHIDGMPDNRQKPRRRRKS